MGREPDVTGLSKQLTKQQIQCTEEVKSLMECMARQGLVDADTGCTRQRTAALFCLKHAMKTNAARALLNQRLKHTAAMFKRFGFK